MREHGRPVSQRRLAELVGVSKRSVERWEKHGITPRGSEMTRLALALGVEEAYFFLDDTDARVVGDVNAAQLADALEQMSTALGELGEALMVQVHTMRPQKDAA